jgi:hypothetical protein
MQDPRDATEDTQHGVLVAINVPKSIREIFKEKAASTEYAYAA